MLKPIDFMKYRINNLLEKKLLNIINYNVFFLRTNVESNILDNNNIHFSTNFSYKPRFFKNNIMPKKQYDLGVIMIQNEVHAKTNLWSFKTYVYLAKISSIKIVSLFSKKLNAFCNNKTNLFDTKIKLSVLVIKVKKGGFSCYSNGFIGFLPRYHLKYYFLRLLKSFRKNFKKFCFTNIFFFNLLSLKFNIFRISVYFIKITINSRKKYKNFSKISRYRRKLLRVRFSYLFITRLKKPKN